MSEKVTFVYANNLGEAEKARNEGFEPVECAFGLVSVVGPRELDHHGAYSKNEAVSIKAAKLAIGGDRHGKFVVAGRPDHDQIYACAVLSSSIPAVLAEAEAVAEMDTDPIGRDRTSSRYLNDLLFEQTTKNLSRDCSGAYQALALLVDIYTRAPSQEELSIALDLERKRRECMLEQIVACEEGKVALAISDERGFGEWYTRAPIVVLYNPAKKSITLGLNPKKGSPFFDYNGFDLLGASGFMPIYSEFDKATRKSSSGGREVVGGSPRGVSMSQEDAGAYYTVLVNVVGRKI